MVILLVGLNGQFAGAMIYRGANHWHSFSSRSKVASHLGRKPKNRRCGFQGCVSKETQPLWLLASHYPIVSAMRQALIALACSA